MVYLYFSVWLKPVSVAACAHAFMIGFDLSLTIWKMRGSMLEGGNFHDGHHVTSLLSASLSLVIHSTAWHAVHKREKVKCPGKSWDSRSELSNNPNPKSGPKNWIKPRSAVIIKYLPNPRIRRTIHPTWITDPDDYFVAVRMRQVAPAIHFFWSMVLVPVDNESKF